jgi:hypothetical protein
LAVSYHCTPQELVIIFDQIAALANRYEPQIAARRREQQAAFVEAQLAERGRRNR